MVKSQKELFEIQENDAVEENTTKKKQKKVKKTMTDEAKQALIERLKAGKERKRLEREGMLKSTPPKNIDKDVEIKKEPIKKIDVVNETQTKLDPRDLEIKELKNMIKETKNKLEMQSLKDELKELRKLIKEEKKQEEIKHVDITKSTESTKEPLKLSVEDNNIKKEIPIVAPQPKQIRIWKKTFS